MFSSRLIVAGLTLLATSSNGQSLSCDSVESGYQCSPEISQYWGQYSPYFTVPSEIDNAIPATCEVTSVFMLSRHGARDPTASKTELYNATVAAIQNSTTSYGAGYEFIEDYEYTLGADQLTAFGQQELVNAGVKFYQRYKSLARDVTPFVRSSGEDRVVESAQNWTQGFHQARLAAHCNDSDAFPYDIVIISEDEGVNNTLSHSICTAFEDGPDHDINDAAQAIWTAVFAPNITARLNANLVGANLTDEQTIYLMDLCPFNTVANAAGNISEWCSLFITEEWQQYGYYESLDKYYGYGYGNPLGPTQGVGFTNELIARLTNTSVQDHTSTNSTLDSSPDTFPLGLPLYADFSHDNDMTAIYSALGLYNATAPLSNVTLETTAETNGYSASWTVPFAARMYVEKMTCSGADEELVRVLVNDRVIPLETCGADELGRCTLNAFVASLSFAESGGFWDQCFA
ncbi:putative 3-phytase [Seiridium cardinale]|uniref:Phytase A n=1 Tax=Seiridium cardinale TaxID=138064 RepID=A0ABR2XPZ5_9PEZI